MYDVVWQISLQFYWILHVLHCPRHVNFNTHTANQTASTPFPWLSISLLLATTSGWNTPLDDPPHHTFDSRQLPLLDLKHPSATQRVSRNLGISALAPHTARISISRIPFHTMHSTGPPLLLSSWWDLTMALLSPWNSVWTSVLTRQAEKFLHRRFCPLNWETLQCL